MSLELARVQSIRHHNQKVSVAWEMVTESCVKNVFIESASCGENSCVKCLLRLD